MNLLVCDTKVRGITSRTVTRVRASRHQGPGPPCGKDVRFRRGVTRVRGAAVDGSRLVREGP